MDALYSVEYISGYIHTGGNSQWENTMANNINATANLVGAVSKNGERIPYTGDLSQLNRKQLRAWKRNNGVIRIPARMVRQ